MKSPQGIQKLPSYNIERMRSKTVLGTRGEKERKWEKGRGKKRGRCSKIQQDETENTILRWRNREG
jgi:hypothetical protein